MMGMMFFLAGHVSPFQGFDETSTVIVGNTAIIYVLWYGIICSQS